MTPGETISLLRESAGMKQKELADKLEINRSVLNRIEQGLRPIRDDELKKIANFFNVSSDYILGTPRVMVYRNKDGTVDVYEEAPEYYHDPKTAELAQAAHDNPDLKILFDASRKLKPEDLETVTRLVRSLTEE